MSSILAIEDDPGIADVLRRGLRLAGHAVVVAPDGESGRRCWAAEAWDLVILDVMLPDTDGLELLAERRAAGDSTPVVVLTAREDSDLRGRASEVGAAERITKPFVYADLLAIVAKNARSRS